MDYLNDLSERNNPTEQTIKMLGIPQLNSNRQ